MDQAITLLLFVVYFSSEAQSKCLQPPIGGFPTSCTIGNLTAISDMGINLINPSLCNVTTNVTNLNSVPTISLTNTVSLATNRTYLLTAIDLKTRTVLWLVGNITAIKGNLTPLSSTSKAQPIYDYHRPHLNSSVPHEIQFLIFEENKNHTAVKYSNDISQLPSNLEGWLDKQYLRGITVCGPVAEGSVLVYAQPIVLPPPISRFSNRTATTTTTKPNSGISNTFNSYLNILGSLICFILTF